MMKALLAATVLLGATMLAGPATAQGMGGMSGMNGMGMGGMGMGGMAGHRARMGPVDCSKAADPARCEARRTQREEMMSTRQTARQACGSLTDAAQRRDCMAAYMHPGGDCSKAPNPARCEAMLKARERCKSEVGPAFRECIRQHTP